MGMEMNVVVNAALAKIIRDHTAQGDKSTDQTVVGEILLQATLMKAMIAPQAMEVSGAACGAPIVTAVPEGVLVAVPRVVGLHLWIAKMYVALLRWEEEHLMVVAVRHARDLPEAVHGRAHQDRIA
jgi:hypothetical protein